MKILSILSISDDGDAEYNPDGPVCSQHKYAYDDDEPFDGEILNNCGFLKVETSEFTLSMIYPTYLSC